VRRCHLPDPGQVPSPTVGHRRSIGPGGLQSDERSGPIGGDLPVRQSGFEVFVCGPGQSDQCSRRTGLEIETTRHPLGHGSGPVNRRRLSDVQLSQHPETEGVESGCRGGQLGEVPLQSINRPDPIHATNVPDGCDRKSNNCSILLTVPTNRA
jgi:hypothetical protein